MKSLYYYKAILLARQTHPIMMKSTTFTRQKQSPNYEHKSHFFMQPHVLDSPWITIPFPTILLSQTQCSCIQFKFQASKYLFSAYLPDMTVSSGNIAVSKTDHHLCPRGSWSWEAIQAGSGYILNVC